MDAEWLDWLQWPAMVVTICAAWLVASSSEARRKWGFWVYVLSNALWVAWALHTRAWGLISLQAALLVMNIRGLRKNSDEASSH